MHLFVPKKIIMYCGSCLLFLLHFMYNFINYISINIQLVFRITKRLCYRTFFSNHGSMSFLQEEVRCFPKLPKHFAVIIEEEDISYNDCIKLILWCTQLGIPFITFYSFGSAINPTSLYEVLCKKCKNSLQSIKWGKSFHSSVKEMAKRDINGYIWAPTIEVNMFSSKSVYESIENVLLRFCHHGIDPDKIDLASVDEKFKEEIPLPDPCFAIIFGNTFSTFGFMPWQIRVTELLHVETHHKLNIEDFISALRRYAYCDQRFGK